MEPPGAIPLNVPWTVFRRTTWPRPTVVAEGDPVVLGAAALRRLPRPAEDRGVPDLVVLDEVAVPALDPDPGRADLVDPAGADRAVRRVAEVHALPVVARTVVADLEVLDPYVAPAVDDEPVLEPGRVDRVGRGRAPVGELEVKPRPVEEEAARGPGCERLEGGQAVVAVEAPRVRHDVAGREPGPRRPRRRPRPSTSRRPRSRRRRRPGSPPAASPGRRWAGARCRSGQTQSDALAVDAGLDEDEVAGPEQIRRALDRPQGEPIELVPGSLPSPGRDVERAQSGLGQCVGPGREGRPCRSRHARDAVRVGTVTRAS